jgi:hypothetical protein
MKLTTPHKFTLLGRLIPGAIALAAFVGVIAIQRSQLDRSFAGTIDPQQAEAQEAWRLKLLKQMPAFGFDNLVADWTFLNFLQYSGDTPAREQTGYSLGEPYFDLITQRDPRFVGVYLFLSGTVSHQLAKPERAIEFMDRGTAALSPQIDPKAFQVWRFKGLDQLLLVGDVPGAIQSHEMAAKWVVGTLDRDFEPLFRQTANFLRRDPNSQLVRFQAWTAVYAQAVAVRDQKTIQRAETEIINLGGQKRLDAQGQVEFFLPKPQVPTSR